MGDRKGKYYNAPGKLQWRCTHRKDAPSRDMEGDPKGSILYADRVVSGVIPLPTIVWKKSGRYCFVTLRWLRILSFCTPFVKWVQLLYLHLFVLFVGDMIPNIVLSYFVELIYLGWIDLADSIARIDGLNDMGRCVFKLSGKKIGLSSWSWKKHGRF